VAGRTARTEVVAALTAVALLAPETVAFALIAGVPAAQALAAAPLCVLAYAVVGRSVRILAGATAATAVLAAAAVQHLPFDPDQRGRQVIVLTLLTGGILLLTGLLRAGFVARFVAPEALRGFLFGLAVVIGVRQVAVLADVATRTGDVFERSWDVLRAVRQWSLVSVLTGVVALGVLLVLERRWPRLPAVLIVLITASAVAAGLHLNRHGVADVPRVPAGFPRLALPHAGAGTWLALVPAAAGLALISFALTHGIAERLAGPDDPPADPSREMTGLGAANLLAGLAGGLPVAGSPSASSAAAGGRTRWLPALCVALLLVVAVALAPVFVLVPEPVLAAVVIMAVRPFLSLAQPLVYLRQDRRATIVWSAAALGVMLFTLVPGLLIAVGLSLLIFIADASRLRVSRLGRAPDGAYLDVERFPELSAPAGVVVLRPDGPVFFANVERLAAAVNRVLAGGERVVVLDLAASFELGASAVDGLARIRHGVEKRGGRLMLVHLYLDARRTIEASELADVPAYATVDDAVAAVPVP
jgi:MFS superfamily sulfate permease-like transporter